MESFVGCLPEVAPPLAHLLAPWGSFVGFVTAVTQCLAG